jgi:hypothetical protein
MSADKRKKILLVFGGLAVVLIAVIAIVRPSFKSEDAIGAIGAVQKHRAPQIAKTDVILGDEQLRQTQKLAYTDFLKDAATLQSLSRDFSAAAKTSNAQATYAAMSLGVKAHQQEVLARSQTEIIAVLIAMRQLAEADSAVGNKKAAMIAEIDNLAARARNRDLGSVEAVSLAAKLQDVENALGMTKQEFVEKVAHKDPFSTIRNREALGAAKAAVENRKFDEARAALAQFYALSKQAELGQQLRSEVGYAESMAREAVALAQIDASLNSANRERLGLLVVIANAARDLEAHAAANMRQTMDNATAEYESLSNFAAATESFSRDQNFSRDFASLEARRADYAHQIQAESFAQVNAISSHLANANALGVQANQSLGTQMRAIESLGTQVQYASMLKGVSNLDSNIKQGSMAKQNTSLEATKK